MRIRITKELIEDWLKEIEKTGGQYYEVELKEIGVEDVGEGLLKVIAKRHEEKK